MMDKDNLISTYLAGVLHSDGYYSSYVQLIGFEHPDKRDKASKAGEYYGYVN